MEIEVKKIKDLKPNPLNPRKSSVTQDENLKKSLEKFGVVEPIVFNKQSGYIVGGHFRVRELKKLGYKEVECVIVDLSPDDEKELLIRLNANTGDWDTDLLLQDWDADKLADWGVDIELTEDKEELKETAKRKLSEKFIVPPFSILDTRQGYWQERKRFWRELINDNGESRFESMGYFNPEYKEKNNLQTGFKSIGQSVSLLDPVLSEIINNWFGLPNSKTFDCFAGDSVFGYVSSYLGNQFTGIELRKEQADLNNKRIKGFNSKYICDDGQNVLKHIEKNSQDLLFSCPPYFNLEVYSDLKNDASNQKEYRDFLKILENAFTDSIKCLKENRFAVIVVGDIRDKKGAYRRFVDDIKDIFKINNTILYNSLILIEQIGTKAMTVNKSMDNRKIGKCHQNVLVFFKGDPKKIKEIYPKIEYASEDLEPFAMDNGNEPE
jgi:DNA modification methylase